MPPAITASPHRATPSRASCTAPTSNSPRPFPSLVCRCPLGKNFSLNVFFSEYSSLTPTGKPPPLAVRLEKALPFRRWVAARASCGGAPRPRPRPNPKHNAENDGQEAHQAMRQSEKRGRGATHASQPHEGCPLLHPLQGVSCLSTPLQGGILKPPALRVVDDLRM